MEWMPFFSNYANNSFHYIQIILGLVAGDYRFFFLRCQMSDLCYALFEYIYLNLFSTFYLFMCVSIHIILYNISVRCGLSQD